MLILTRKHGESLRIGGDVRITVVEIKGNQVRIGIDAPRSCPIYREEIYLQIQSANKEAVESIPEGADVPSMVTAELSGLRSPRIASVSPRLPQARQAPGVQDESINGKVNDEGDGGAGDA
jgi:carbon storage regulator